MHHLTRFLALALVLGVLLVGGSRRASGALESYTLTLEVTQSRPGVAKPTKFTATGTMTIDLVTGDMGFDVVSLPGLGTSTLTYVGSIQRTENVASAEGTIETHFGADIRNVTNGVAIFTGKFSVDASRLKGKLRMASANAVGPAPTGFAFLNARLTAERVP